MQKLKWMPIAIAGLTLVVVMVMVLGYEKRLDQGRIIYAKLAPLDPCSLIQGDYMSLAYELNAKEGDAYFGERKLGYASLSPQNVITSVQWEPSADQKIWLKNHWGRWQLPVDSFMFAEGLAECYDSAQFAKISVTDDGKMMLLDLVGDSLQDLDCQSQASWWQGGLVRVHPN